MAKRHSALFVCLGNICRSPIAETILKNMLVQKGLDKEWLVDSAATSRYEIGSLPDPRARKVMKQHGLSSEHRARQITHEDYRNFEYIFGMDESNMEDLRHMAPREPYKAKLVMLGTYDESGPDIIEDPYYGHDDQDFQDVYEQCTRALEMFLKSVSSQ